MNIPIKNDPNERIARDSPRVRKNEPVDNKFQSELDSTKSTARLKKHSKDLDSESDEELVKVKDDSQEHVSLFDLSAGTNKKKGVPAGYVPDQLAENQLQKPVQGMPLPDPSLLMGSMAQAKVEKQPSDALNKIQEIVQKLIAEIHQMEMKGKTDTIVTLNNPPLLKGAQLVMTSFDSAKGELNIAFENLSSKAKTFLDSNNHLDLLKLHLEQKGYITHIITTSTLQETKTFTQTQQQQPRNDDREDPRQQQQQGRNQEENEDEK